MFQHRTRLMQDSLQLLHECHKRWVQRESKGFADFCGGYVLQLVGDKLATDVQSADAQCDRQGVKTRFLSGWAYDAAAWQERELCTACFLEVYVPRRDSRR
jgi:hypothetical protein